MRRTIATLVGALLTMNTIATPIHDNIKQLQQNIHLGKVGLIVSANNELASRHFELGLGFLHAFMYQLAIDQFKAAQKCDPGFMMAYWGEAMAYKHPIWNVENLEASRNALARYQHHKDHRPLSDKEQRYLKAAQAYFNGSTRQQRDDQYINSMKQFYAAYPNDPNVGAFYALSILGRASDFANETSSQHDISYGRKLITTLYQQFPQHPGIVHYFMHYHDVMDQSVAIQALPAAKTALTLMRSSSHVTHMAAHIYRRLEYWPQFVAANQQSVAAADQLCLLINGKLDYRCNADNKYHSLEWLQYGNIKLHHYKQANQAFVKMTQVYLQDQSLPYKQWYYRMWSRHIIANHLWHTKAITIDPIAQQDGQLYWSSYSECAALLAKGLLKAHQVQPIKPTLNRLDRIIVLTSTLREPYIGQTCQMAKLKIETEYAKMMKQPRKAAAYASQQASIAKQRHSTALTPSLSILPSSLN